MRPKSALESIKSEQKDRERETQRGREGDKYYVYAAKRTGSLERDNKADMNVPVYVCTYGC